MDKRELALLGVRLLALYFLINALPALVQPLQYVTRDISSAMEQARFDADNLSTSQTRPPPSLLELVLRYSAPFLPALCQLIAAGELWRRGPRLARALTVEVLESQPLPMPSNEVRALAFWIFGLLLAVGSVPLLVAAMVHDLFGLLSYSRLPGTFNIYYYFEHFGRAALGLYLIIGGRGLVGLGRFLRANAHEPLSLRSRPPNPHDPS